MFVNINIIKYNQINIYIFNKYLVNSSTKYLLKLTIFFSVQ